MHNSHQSHESRNTPEETIKHLEQLIEFAKNGMLDTSELEAIKDLATKNRQIEAVETKDDQGGSGTGEKDEDKTIATDIKGELNANSLLDGINKGDIGYGIFGTNGRDTGHAIQSTNTEGIGMGFCDAMSNVNSTIQNDPNNLFLRIFPEKIPGYATIALRVADNRVDRRPGSHTTVILFIKGVQDSIKLETLAKNTEELKDIMKAILERQNSPLRGAEQKVKRSFLV